MKAFKSRPLDSDCRICGSFNSSPLGIARAITKDVLESEALHSHQGYEYYFFIKGKAELLINNKVLIVKAGDVILVEPGEKHRVKKVIEEIDYMTIKTNSDPSDKVSY